VRDGPIIEDQIYMPSGVTGSQSVDGETQVGMHWTLDGKLVGI
jgi:hypothetical protein